MHILCAFGCVYQMYNLNVIYFSYETTTNVRYETQTDTYLPAITVCYEKRLQIKNEFLDMFEGNISRSLDVLNSLTIQDQFKAMKSPMSRILCSAEIKGKGNVSCTDVSNFTQYISAFSYCVTIFPQLNNEQDDNYQVDVSAFIVKFLMKNYPVKHLDTIQIYLHQRKELFRKDDYRGTLVIDLHNTDICVVKYKTVIHRYNFKPNPECFVGQTRDECIFQCVIDQNFIKTKSYPWSYMTNDLNSTLKFDFTFNDTQNLNEQAQICTQLCDLKTECERYYFSKYPIFWKNPDFRYDQGNFTKILIEYPAHPTSLYEISLKMTFEEYLCLMSSIFSLWFGFSILMFTDFCRLLFIKFKFYFQTITVNNMRLKFPKRIKVTNVREGLK